MEEAVVQVGRNTGLKRLLGRFAALRFIFKQPFWALGLVGI